MRSILLVLILVLASPVTLANAPEAPQPAQDTRMAALTTGEHVPLPPSMPGATEDRSDATGRLSAGASPAPLPRPRPHIPRLSHEEICHLVETAAAEHEIPVRFFTNLIWKESSFRIAAVSEAGARGIAQFMPVTAREVGLENPFDPRQALPASAGLLQDLRRRFGNLGLAAAAYNAGARRVWDWLGERGELPEETRAYVETVTGRPASHWAGLSRRAAMEARKRQVRQDRCIEVAEGLKNPVTASVVGDPPLPPARPRRAGNWQTARL